MRKIIIYIAVILSIVLLVYYFLRKRRTGGALDESELAETTVVPPSPNQQQQQQIYSPDQSPLKEVLQKNMEDNFNRKFSGAELDRIFEGTDNSYFRTWIVGNGKIVVIPKRSDRDELLNLVNSVYPTNDFTRSLEVLNNLNKAANKVGIDIIGGITANAGNWNNALNDICDRTRGCPPVSRMNSRQQAANIQLEWMINSAKMILTKAVNESAENMSFQREQAIKRLVNSGWRISGYTA